MRNRREQADNHAPKGDEFRIETLRDEALNRIWSGLGIVAIVAVPFSLSRAGATGWLPMYAAHALIGVFVVVTALFRHRLKPATKTALMMGVFWSIGVLGVFTLGLLGAGTWWLVISALLMSLVHSVRAGLVTIAAVAGVICIAAALFVGGQLKLGFDAQNYMQQPSAWATLLVATILMPYLIFQAVAVFIEKLDAQRREIRNLALFDELTGVPTRRLAKDRLRQAMVHVPRSGDKVGVMFIDLDGFKQVNDEYGHAAGDHVLCTVSQRCLALLRADDTLAREGGDEFLVILQGVSSSGGPRVLAQKILTAISEPITYGVNQLQIGASIGIALAPDQTNQGDELIALADAAMYQAKRAGKNRIIIAGESARPMLQVV